MSSKAQLKDEPSFEQALTQLEQLVAGLEQGEPELTRALGKYEDGVRLLKLCYRLLDEAEQSVALLTGVDAQGEPQTAPFDATATITREVAPTALPTSNLAPDEPARRKQAQRRSRENPTAVTDVSADDEGPPF
jgi:exodeoxyribonuclease VII small subunit